jgi:hypothetical protein
MNMKLYWKVQPEPSGRYRAFEHRGWPVAYYGKPDESKPAAALYCEDDYRPASVRLGNHKEIKVCVYWHAHEKNPTSWTVFTLRKRAATLDEAKQMVQEFLDSHPEWQPKEKTS